MGFSKQIKDRSLRMSTLSEVQTAPAMEFHA